MSVIDRFLDAIKLNDDYDDEDDFIDDDFDDEEEYSSSKVKPRFFKRIDDDPDDLDSFDDEDDIAPPKKETAKPKTSSLKSSSSKSSTRRERTASPQRTQTQTRKSAPKQQKRRSGSSAMEVSVIKPVSMEDGRDTLLDDCTVVLNLEGLDVDLAQRIIDFTCGACYSIGGSIQMISSYIFILTPSSVDITGDYQSLLDDAFDIPAMRSQY